MSDHTFVLVVDDHPDIRQVVSLLLEHNGFNVEVARDGWEAIRAVERQRPDVILMDLSMPRMDGISAARALNENGRCGIPILAVTARAAPRAELERAGFCGMLRKPVASGTLVRTIRACLGSNGAANGWIGSG